jgi:hypothetical protein
MKIFLTTLLVFIVAASPAVAGISLYGNLVCTYDYLQTLDPDTQESKKHRPLIWNFSNLGTEESMYSSGGDIDTIQSYFNDLENTVFMIIPDRNGAQIFTILASGDAYWSKHASILGLSSMAQQLRGKCSNVKKFM